MARYVLQDQQGREFEIEAPDDASEEEVLSHAERLLASEKQDQAAQGTGGGFGSRIAAGAKQAMKEYELGARQLKSRVAGSQSEAARLRDEIRASRDGYDHDSDGFAGTLGYYGTKIGLPVAAGLALAAGAPATAGYAGAVGLGALMGALEPTLEEDEVFGMPASVAHPLTGAVGGAGGQAVGNALSRLLSKRLASKTAELETKRAQNAMRDAETLEAQNAGYSVPPAAANPDSKLAGAVQNFAGRQLPTSLQTRNQVVTDMLGRKALGIPEKEPLTPATLHEIRRQAGQDYEVVRKIPYINWDDEFLGEIQGQVPALKTATQFGSDKEIAKRAQAFMDKKSWSGEEFVEEIRRLKELEKSTLEAARRAEGEAPRIEKEELAKALHGFREALESLAERNLSSQGLDPEIINNFRAARARIAMTHDIEDALTPDGHIDAKVIGRKYKARRDKLPAPSGGRQEPSMGRQQAMNPHLAKIGRAHERFGRALEAPDASLGNRVATAFELAGIGAAPFFGVPLGAAAAYPMARIGTRAALGTRAGQGLLARPPSYEPGMSYRLPPKLTKRALGPTAGVLGAGYED